MVEALLFLILLLLVSYALTGLKSSPQREGAFDFLDGIRGVAALIVVLFHFIKLYYPGFIHAQAEQFFTPLQYTLATSPWYAIYSGRFSVAIFFVLSGFVLSLGFFKKPSLKLLVSSASRRYTRLAIPILVTNAMYLTLITSGVYGPVQNKLISLGLSQPAEWFKEHFSFDFSLLNMIKDSLIDTMFMFGHAKYNFPLWTMSIEFYGSLTVFLTLAIVSRFQKKQWAYLALMAFFAIFIRKYEMLLFIAGSWLCWLTLNNQLPVISSALKRWGITLFLLLAGLYLGSINLDLSKALWYKSHFAWLTPTPLFYNNLYKIGFFVLGLGAFSFITAVLINPVLKQWFASRICRYLGKISFGMYLSHYAPFATINPWIFIYCYQTLHYSYPLSALIAFVLTMPVIFGLAHVVTIVADEAAIELGRRFYKQTVEPVYDQLAARFSPRV